MLHEISDYSLLQSLHCYRACRCYRDYNHYSHYSATTHATEIALRRLQRTATELADAKTRATEHYSCLIGVGACEPEREALTQKKACVTTAMRMQQHTII